MDAEDWHPRLEPEDMPFARLINWLVPEKETICLSKENNVYLSFQLDQKKNHYVAWEAGDVVKIMQNDNVVFEVRVSGEIEIIVKSTSNNQLRFDSRCIKENGSQVCFVFKEGIIPWMQEKGLVLGVKDNIRNPCAILEGDTILRKNTKSTVVFGKELNVLTCDNLHNFVFFSSGNYSLRSDITTENINQLQEINKLRKYIHVGPKSVLLENQNCLLLPMLSSKKYLCNLSIRINTPLIETSTNTPDYIFKKLKTIRDCYELSGTYRSVILYDYGVLVLGYFNNKAIFFVELLIKIDTVVQKQEIPQMLRLVPPWYITVHTKICLTLFDEAFRFLDAVGILDKMKFSRLILEATTKNPETTIISKPIIGFHVQWELKDLIIRGFGIKYIESLVNGFDVYLKTLKISLLEICEDNEEWILKTLKDIHCIGWRLRVSDYADLILEGCSEEIERLIMDGVVGF